MNGYSAVIERESIVKISLYVNTGRQTMAAVKKIFGCDYIMNAGFFNLSTFQPATYIVSNGRVLSAGGSPYGYAMSGGKIVFSYANKVGYQDFIGGYPLLVKDGEKALAGVPEGLGGCRGRSAMGLTDDSLVLRCVSEGSGADGDSLDELARHMMALGCINAVNLDGGASSQFDFDGVGVTASRIVHSFLCVWTKEETQTDVFMNSGTRKAVYETTACKKQIGSLDPYECCSRLYSDADFCVVMYNVTGKNERKVGFITR